MSETQNLRSRYIIRGLGQSPKVLTLTCGINRNLSLNPRADKIRPYNQPKAKIKINTRAAYTIT